MLTVIFKIHQNFCTNFAKNFITINMHTVMKRKIRATKKMQPIGKLYFFKINHIPSVVWVYKRRER